MTLSAAPTHPNHPSNKLYHNKVENFEEAIELVFEECDFEIGLFNDDNDDDRQARSSIQEFKERAQRAMTLYRSHTGSPVSSKVKLLRNEGLDEFADALESGDYRELAI